ncbi:MAG: carboxypeptidase regulatory-like domain-containing protein, partial [Candidatus Bathyarchaeia archaeon]
SKQLLAVLMVAIFVLGIALIAVPTQAHTTLGRPTGTMPYRVRDADLPQGHVPGPTGYVWPGSGKDWYTGELATGEGDLNEPPGYQSPWTQYPPGPPWPTWWQLRTNTYAPFGAILTSTDDFINKGDLIFAINFTKWDGISGDFNYTSWTIYIPPEFIPPVDWEGGDTSNIVVSMHESPMIDEKDVSVSVFRADVKDPFGPNWWVIRIEADDTWALTFQGPDYKEWYYVRVNAMGAPKIAGRYIFKMFLNDSFPLMNSVDENGNLRTPPITSTMPAENWPVLLVKGEVDPGIIEGTVRHGSWKAELYGKPIQLPGVVRAVGVTPEGRHVEARGYFNASAKGHFEIEGVAPGTYDIYASAAGYPERKVAEGIVVYPGKSVHLDIYLEPGAIVHGKVFSKHGMADVAWTNPDPSCPTFTGDDGTTKYVAPIMVEIYDSNEWPAPKPGYVWGDINEGVLSESLLFERGTPTELNWTDEGYKPSKPGHLMSFSPINLTDAPYTSYGRHAWDKPSAVAFPWEGPNLGNPASDADPNGIFNGVGPSTVWWTKADWKYFEFMFGNKALETDGTDADGDSVYEPGVYGTPTEFDGHVPQVFATWINGLKPGTYYIRVWTPGYVQTDVFGNPVDYSFTVAAEEWAGDIYVPIDLQLSGKINKTVHFHDLAGEIIDRPIGGPDDGRWLIAEARDNEGNLVAFNFKWVEKDKDSASILLWGFGLAGPDTSKESMRYFLYRYRHIRDYGMMPGTYKVYVYMRGYVQQEFEWASVSLTGGTTYISNHMYRGAGINVTLFSKDWQYPTIYREWLRPGKSITIKVISVETGETMGTIKYWNGNSWEKPEQTEKKVSVPYDGWDPAWSKLKFNGSTACEEDGPDSNNIADGGTENDREAGFWGMGGFVADASYYRLGGDKDWKTVLGLETGSYKFKVSTSGYIFKDADKYVVYAAKGHQADTKLEVVIGGKITGEIIFKKERVMEALPYDIFMEVELYNDDGKLIDTATSFVTKGTSRVLFTFWGVDGSPNYDGGYWIEVDTWTTYRDVTNDEYYPPVTGLLMGKDYHLIGTDPGFQGDACAFNHLGPYEQRTKIRVPSVSLSGEASVAFELDRRGYLNGQVYGFTWCNEMRPISWAKVTAVGESGEFTFYSIDGYYEGFLPKGTYSLTVIAYEGNIGYNSVTASVTVPDGGEATYSFEGLELSHIPIPEFPTAAIALISALAASLYVLRRIKK